MLTRRDLAAAAAPHAFVPAAAELFRGQRGDWSLSVPPGWNATTSDMAERVKRRALADGAQPLLRVMTAIAALARSADAVLFSFGEGDDAGLPVMTINSSAAGTSVPVPRRGDDAVWDELARTYVELEGGSGMRLQKPWYGARAGGEPMTAATWDCALGGKAVREEMIMVQRRNRITSVRLLPSAAATHRGSRRVLWTVANTLSFDEAP